MRTCYFSVILAIFVLLLGKKEVVGVCPSTPKLASNSECHAFDVFITLNIRLEQRA